MALARYVVTKDVTVSSAATTTDRAGNKTIGPTVWSSLNAEVFHRGQLVWADSTAGISPAQLLYQAIGAGNLRAVTEPADAERSTGVSN